MTQNIHMFTKAPLPPVSAVGGKGYSLMNMTHAGLRVPPGFVLSVTFFKEWLDKIKHTEQWSLFREA